MAGNMGNQAEQLKPIPNGNIAQAVEGLRQEARALTTVLDELERRLDPIVSKADDPRAAGMPVPTPALRSSALAECISEEVMTLSHAKARMVRLLQTLDI